MRARNIKPGFYKNENLAECSLAARLLAPGLWMLADREGRLEDRPKRIKGEIFPYDNLDIDQLLGELVSCGHVLRYTINNCGYIQVLTFKDHQRPHANEIDSIIPEYTDTCDTLVTKVASTCHQGSKHFALDTESLTTDSLNPSLLNPSSLNFEKNKQKNSFPEQFEQFWQAFPKQRAGNKAKAYQAHCRALERAPPEVVMAGCLAYAQSAEVAGGMAKGCAAWLNDDRWTSDYSIRAGYEKPNGKSRHCEPLKTGVLTL